MALSEWLQGSTFGKILLMVGGVTVVMVFVASMYFIVLTIKDLIHDLRWEHTYQHRFDKPPTAQCYCRDCKWHGKSGKCALPGITRYTPDNGYCYESEPLTYEEETRKCQNTQTSTN